MSPDSLIGRAEECAVLDRLVDEVTAGRSQVLVIQGDPGMGKTALLAYLAGRRRGIDLIQVTGSDSETNLSYAAVQQLTASREAIRAALPEPQRDALNVAIGLAAGPPPDRFLIGLAVHKVLAESARAGGLLVIVDDLQWLDRESIDALAFAARRFTDEAVGLVVAQRTENAVASFDASPRLDLQGLPSAAAKQLLGQVVTRRLEPRISDRIVTATGGNPLAIIDLAQELSTHQLVGLTLLPEPLPIGSHLESHYQRLTAALPQDVQTWLLVAAAEPAGDPAYINSAATVLGIAVEAADLAETADLVSSGTQIAFRHPLVRSAIYVGATGGQRRRVHNALGAVTRRARDVDRRAWHLAAGRLGPDEDVALLLEQAAERARERGGYSARAAYLARAVDLTVDSDAWVQRSLLAAEAALMAGQPDQALSLLDRLDPATLADVDRGRQLMIKAFAQGFSGADAAMATVPAICQAAAAAFETAAPALARDALITAFERAFGAEWMMTGTTPAELAEHADRLRPPPGDSSVSGLVLAALGDLARGPVPEAVPKLQSVIAALLSDDLSETEILRFGWVSVAFTTAVWDDDAQLRLLGRTADVARRTGAFQILDAMLYILSLTTTILGDLARAAEHLTELRQVRDVLGMSAAQQEMFRNSEYLAWRGEEDGLRETIDSTGRAAVALGLGGAETVARTALMIVDIYQGDYEAAYQIARRNRDLNFMQISVRVLPDLVEAAVRTDRIEQATIALYELREIATASGTSWALGLLERSAGAVAEARVTGDLDDDPADEPESHYAAAIVHLNNSRARADLARTHLMYGEWLRRRKRRRDARVQLRAAADQFQAMGANGFAARALRELAATGSPAGTGAVESADGATTLTVQERSVARLAADGATNATIATTLILSPHTVDYHLRKVYRKLGIGSRRELRTALGGQIPRG